MGASASPALERSVDRWLRAYPPRWREQRGAELRDVVLDLAAPGARRVDLRTAAGLVAGGWRARRSTRPSARVVLAYRLRGRRLDARHDAWLRDDLAGRWYPVRAEAPMAVVCAVLVALLHAVGDLTGHWLTPRGWGEVAAVLLFVVGVDVVRRARHREDDVATAFGHPPADAPGRFGPYVGLDRGQAR
ncbi:hypothetical protein [Cellulomonas fimi]|uniref:Uncharacterized protein n=1 Tax=Cellulomonas fimi (strain ATCC 484 / DSM 20113 / JCM 1341 / CCUG 24087 / LMG 16345 / NBRC 15513 / NCIMB 8980 / NCTC 7547 / NRS-133) TaxID=590998 RepID=F4H0G7_CELFA|nr:hypothetical protein [Cellulomonas fimi]AEE47336.1 hypothetical protein Celf_3222 [Cellulomonas fimi ATCC 484]NNH05834.1 hypothetical protein [Cellulomonas fimi]VEH35964.1 Uncharacterised protein [Cellulomonas fimi]